MADDLKSDSCKKNNLKALILFNQDLTPKVTIHDICKKEKVFESLNKRIKNDDPDEKR